MAFGLQFLDGVGDPYDVQPSEVQDYENEEVVTVSPRSSEEKEDVDITASTTIVADENKEVTQDEPSEKEEPSFFAKNKKWLLVAAGVALVMFAFRKKNKKNRK